MTMPNKPAAEKALRKTKKRTHVSQLTKRQIAYLIKKTRRALHEKQKDTAQKGLRETMRALDRAAQKGILKKNTAGRLKSRLAHALKKSAL